MTAACKLATCLSMSILKPLRKNRHWLETTTGSGKGNRKWKV